jgi:hypothetical protein
VAVDGFRVLADYLASAKRALKPLPLREAEDSRPYAVKPLEGAPVRRVEGGAWRFAPVAVDGSTRKLAGPHFSAYVVGVAVYGLGEKAVDFIPGGLGRRFLALRAPREVLTQVERDGRLDFLIVKRSDGAYLDESCDCTDEDIFDEVRVSMESEALLRVAERGGGGLAVVDGPIYFDHWAKTRLLNVRMAAVEGLRRAGFAAVGVVKRVDKSQKLCAQEVLDALSVEVDRRYCNDAYVASNAAPKSGIYLMGPFHLSYAGGDLRYYAFPDKVFWYASVHGSVFRVEMLHDDFRRLGGEAEEVAAWLAWTATSRWIPYVIDVVDAHAKRLTANLLIALREAVKSRDIPLTYDSEVEFLNALREHVA